MRAPIFVPARSEAAANHGAGDIARAGRGAEGGGARAASPAARNAAHGRSANKDMSRPVPPLRFTEQTSQMIARCQGIGVRAGMPRTAAAVHFARGHARQADMWPFGAPDRPVAIPDRDGGAGKGLAGGNDRGEQEQAEHHRRVRNADHRSIQTPSHPSASKTPREAPKEERALGEAAAGRRARGPVGQPPSGKDAEPSALRGPKVTRGPWRRLPAPEHAQFSRAHSGRGTSTEFSPCTE